MRINSSVCFAFLLWQGPWPFQAPRGGSARTPMAGMAGKKLKAAQEAASTAVAAQQEHEQSSKAQGGSGGGSTQEANSAQAHSPLRNTQQEAYAAQAGSGGGMAFAQGALCVPCHGIGRFEPNHVQFSSVQFSSVQFSSVQFSAAAV